MQTLATRNTLGGARGLAGFEEFTSAVTSAVTNVTNLMQSSVKNRDNELKAKRARVDDDVSGVLHNITMLQEQREIVEGDVNHDRKTKRLKLIDSALD